MLRKVRHLGRKAAKYRFVVSLNQLTVKGTKSWQPHKLVVVLSRRKKKVTGTAQSWRPSIEDPYKGTAAWAGQNQESLEINVTLFEEHNLIGYEPKNWVFAIENEARDGKRKPIATLRVDVAQFVATVSSSHEMDLNMKTLTAKVKSVKLSCAISCSFLSAGPATEADLISLAGSTASEDTIRLGDIDVGNLRDLDPRDFDNSRGSSFIDEANENTLMNQQELKNLTSQIESLNFAIQELPTGGDFNDECAKPRSHRSSIGSATSDHPSAGASSLTPSKGRRNSEVDNVDDNSSESNGTNQRNSITSDSSDNSFQKRRLRPSADFLPETYNESEVSSTNTSPAPAMQKLLLRWCQKVTAGYEGVKVTNFTTSWRNGLALCAVLHHYKPELIDFENLHALNGKRNVKKAVEGFKKLDITDQLSTFSISNKNNLISFLVAVRKSFKNEESPPDSADDSSSVGSKSSFSRSIQKSSHSAPRNIRGSTRVKLLSDLQEKEMEEDVFSSALDDALEQNLSPESKEPKEEISIFFGKQAVNSEKEKPEENVLSDIGGQAVSPKHNVLPSFPSENSETTKISVVSTDLSRNAVPLDIVLSSLGNEATTDPTESKSKEVEKASFKIAEDAPETVETSHSEINTNLIAETKLKTPFDDDITSISDSESNKAEDSRLNPMELNPFEEDTKVEDETKFDKDLDRRTSIENHVFPPKETDLTVSIHLPSSNDDTGEGSLRNSASSSSSCTPAIPPECYTVKGNSPTIPAEAGDNVNVFQNTRDEAAIEIEDDENRSQTSTLDVAVKLSESDSSNGKKDGKSDFQKAVQKLLQSSAERNRKAKALEIIAQTKADMTSSKEVELSAEELKRQEIVKERAQKLIEKTRATLKREKQLDETNDLNKGSRGDSSKLNEINHIFPDVPSSVSPRKSPSSAPEEQSSEEERTEDELLTFSLNSDQKIDLNDQPKNDGSSVFGPVETNQRVKGWSPSSSHSSHSSSHTSSHGRKEEQHFNSHSSAHETKEEQHFNDPLDAFSMAAPTYPELNSSTSSGDVFNPLASIPNPTFHNGSSTSEQVPTDNQENPFHNCFTDPLSATNVEVSSRNEDKPLDDAFASGDARTAATIIDKLSTSEDVEVEKRWSRMLKKSTSSIPANEISEIETEKQALEAEQRMVEERANEVRIEIQEAKKFGGRANRHRETDLTQEWFQLVNKKNAILRQQDLLGLREEEQVILNQVETVHEELIPLMTTEDSMKTFAQKEREMKLLEEKVRLVNERDKIIQLMNEKEKSALDEEERIQTNLEANMNKMMQHDEKCAVM